MNGPDQPTHCTGARRGVNPFATRYTRPGAIPPLDGRGRPLDVAALAATLVRLRAAALQGPHGHGKSTLLAAIATVLRRSGMPVSVVRIRGWPDVVAVAGTLATTPRQTAVFVDGWERLGPLRCPLQLLARLRRGTLLVTTHAPCGLPVLRRCETSPDLLRAIVARLPDHRGLVDDGDVADAFHAHGGDVREALYDLYDRIECRWRAGAAPSGR